MYAVVFVGGGRGGRQLCSHTPSQSMLAAPPGWLARGLGACPRVHLQALHACPCRPAPHLRPSRSSASSARTASRRSCAPRVVRSQLLSGPMGSAGATKPRAAGAGGAGRARHEGRQAGGRLGRLRLERWGGQAGQAGVQAQAHAAGCAVTHAAGLEPGGASQRASAGHSQSPACLPRGAAGAGPAPCTQWRPQSGPPPPRGPPPGRPAGLHGQGGAEAPRTETCWRTRFSPVGAPEQSEGSYYCQTAIFETSNTNQPLMLARRLPASPTASVRLGAPSVRRALPSVV